MASSSSLLVLAIFIAFVSWQAIASDPSPLQDFCVVDKKSPGNCLLHDFGSLEIICMLK
jgi:hypothetical protein